MSRSIVDNILNVQVRVISPLCIQYCTRRDAWTACAALGRDSDASVHRCPQHCFNESWSGAMTTTFGMCKEGDCSTTPRAATIITPKSSAALASCIPTRPSPLEVASELADSPGSCSLSARQGGSSGHSGAQGLMTVLPLRGSAMEARANRIADVKALHQVRLYTLHVAYPYRDTMLLQKRITHAMTRAHIYTYTYSLAHARTHTHTQAALTDDAKTCLEILERNPSLVDDRDPHGRTALHAAAFAGSVFAANVLIRAGADISATTKEKKTPLLLAVPPCRCGLSCVRLQRFCALAGAKTRRRKNERREREREIERERD